jgi:hypothetical protein
MKNLNRQRPSINLLDDPLLSKCNLTAHIPTLKAKTLSISLLNIYNVRNNCLEYASKQLGFML